MAFGNVTSVPLLRKLTPDGNGYSLRVPVLHVTSSTKPGGSIVINMNKHNLFTLIIKLMNLCLICRSMINCIPES